MTDQHEYNQYLFGIYQQDKRGNEALTELVKTNMGIVHHAAQACHKATDDDAIQQGSLALTEAIMDWDGDEPLIDHAYSRVLGAIKSESKYSSAVKLPERTKSKMSRSRFLPAAMKLDSALTALTGILGRKPTLQEIYDSYHLEPEVIDELLEFLADGEPTTEDIQPAKGDDDLDGLGQILKQEFSLLDEIEIKVLEFYFFKGLTVTAIAQSLKKSQGRISQIKKSALEKLSTSQMLASYA